MILIYRALLTILILGISVIVAFGIDSFFADEKIYRTVPEAPEGLPSVEPEAETSEPSDIPPQEPEQNTEPTQASDEEPEIEATLPSSEEILVAVELPTPTPAPTYGLMPGFSSVNEQTRAAVVNILCSTRASGIFKPITGSGIIIDSRGVILTNAHIGQYFLLTDYPTEGNVSCVIRSGSPARNLYTAELLYLPSEWILKNRTAIRIANPTGTGEHDYAFLRITGTTGPGELPGSFPFVPIDIKNSRTEVGDTVLLVSYPAGLLGGTTIIKDLYLVSANSSILEIFTFGGNTPDLISTGGSVVAQKGSSGGAVVSVFGGLQGIVVTSTEGETTGDRDLRAITTSHIDRSMKSISKYGITDLLDTSLAPSAKSFAETIAPALTNILINELNK